MAPILIPPQLERAWSMYEQHFGKEYPLHLSCHPWKDQVKDILYRIETNTPARDDTPEEQKRCY